MSSDSRGGSRDFSSNVLWNAVLVKPSSPAGPDRRPYIAAEALSLAARRAWHRSTQHLRRLRLDDAHRPEVRAPVFAELACRQADDKRQVAVQQAHIQRLIRQ